MKVCKEVDDVITLREQKCYLHQVCTGNQLTN